MKRIPYNKVDGLLKELTVFFSSLLFFLFFTTFLVAQEFKHTEVVSEGRAVIIEGDVETAKKRALDDALYMASLQACLLYTSPSPRDRLLSRMPSSA